jgi:hypothetical protein
MVAVITVQVTGDVELIAKYDAMARRNDLFSSSS